MTTGRLEAFSDGVIAIIITIMVLELHVPQGADISALRPLVPVALSYVLSFIYVGIYWTNHHHMFQAAEHVTGGILWANLYFLFWLSLIPFVTNWMGDTHFAALPMAAYGAVLLMTAIAYIILQWRIVVHEGPNSLLAHAVGREVKGKVSAVLTALAIPAAFIHPGIAGAFYIIVALTWLVPDRRIEQRLNTSTPPNSRPPERAP